MLDKSAVICIIALAFATFVGAGLEISGTWDYRHMWTHFITPGSQMTGAHWNKPPMNHCFTQNLSPPGCLHHQRPPWGVPASSHCPMKHSLWVGTSLKMCLHESSSYLLVISPLGSLHGVIELDSQSCTEHLGNMPDRKGGCLTHWQNPMKNSRSIAAL
jgi:hypothetical protein